MRFMKVKMWLLVFMVMSIAFSISIPIASAASVSIANGSQFIATDGSSVQAHGGGMIKVGSYYYWLGEDRDGTNYVSLYRSTDLKSWEFRAHLLSKTTDPALASVNIERPKIIYNAATNKYVLWAHKENAWDYTEARVLVATATNIEGPYTYQSDFQPLGNESRDMTVFNDNGTAYLISSAAGNSEIHIYRLTSDFLNVQSLEKVLWPGEYREAPAVFKRNGVYFMVTSGASYWWPNQGKYATATSMNGTWSALSNLGDSTTYDSQSTYIQPIEGTQTSYLYMGDRWAGANNKPVNDSTYVWLPLEFPTSTTLSMSLYGQINVDAAAGTMTSTPNGTFGDASAIYKVINRNSGKSLSLTDNSSLSGADTNQWIDGNTAVQMWRLEAVDSTYFKIINVQTGKVLGVENGSSSDGAVIEQWTDGGWWSQHWKFIGSGNYYKIQNRASGKLIDVNNTSSANGEAVIQWSDNNGWNQQWSMIRTN